MTVNNELQKPFFSVIMSSFNNFDTVEMAIKSVLCQNYKDFELILINDGSTDATGSIMAGYAQSYSFVTYFSNNVNIGKPLSINLGVLHARGHYICIADADDIWRGNKLAIQSKVLLENPEIDVLGGQVQRFGLWGKSRIPTSLPLTNLEIHRKFRKGIMAINNPTVAIRTECFLFCGGHRGYFRRNEDFDLFLRMHRLGYNFRNVENILTDYRTKTAIQPLKYWLLAEFGRQEILLANAGKIRRIFPIISLPKIIFDLFRLILIFVVLSLKERFSKNMILNT